MTNDQFKEIIQRIDIIIDQLMTINDFSDQKSQILYLDKRQFTAGDIANILNTTSNTVRVTLSKYRKK